jgi:hypothetical protein
VPTADVLSIGEVNQRNRMHPPNLPSK